MGLTELAEVIGADPAVLRDLLPPDVLPVAPPDAAPSTQGHDFSWLAAGDPVEILVGYSSSEVVVAAPDIRWDGHVPVMCVADAETRSLGCGLMQWFSDQVVAMRSQRTATFVACGRCRRSTPPEWMLDDELCQRCADEDGVVF